MLMAKKAGHFQEIGFAQSGFFPAVRTWNYQSQVLAGKLDVSTAGGAGHFQPSGGIVSVGALLCRNPLCRPACF